MNKVELHRALTRVLAARIPRDCVGDVELLRDYIENSEPVKHGRWIDFPECLEYEGALDEEYFVCSECHHVWNTIDNCAETFRYCPNCGSKNEDGDSDGR